MSQPKAPNETSTEPQIDKISAAFTLLNNSDLVNASLSVDVRNEGQDLNVSIANYKNAIEIVIQGLSQLTLLLKGNESLEHAVKNIDSFLRMRVGVTNSLKNLSPEQRAEKITVEKVRTYFSIAKEVLNIFLIPENTTGPITLDGYLASLRESIGGYLKIQVEGFNQSFSIGQQINQINQDSQKVRLACLEILMNALKYGSENEDGNLIVEIKRENKQNFILFSVRNRMGKGYSYEHSSNYGLSFLKATFGEKTSTRQTQDVFIVEIYVGSLVES